MIKEMYYWLMFFLRKIGKTEMLEFNSYLLICIVTLASTGELFAMFLNPFCVIATQT